MFKRVASTFLCLLALAGPAAAQRAGLFPPGEVATTDNHTGTVWLNELSAPDSVFRYSIAAATFAPGAKLDWHRHPGGQILLITEGTGYYQERGQPRRTVQKGDVVKCRPGVEHWHGASPNSRFAYLATTPTQQGKTIWLNRVTEEEYRRIK